MLTKKSHKKLIVAIKKSIKHWEQRAKTGAILAQLDCPICAVPDGCTECPIMMVTGKYSCTQTPGQTWECFQKPGKSHKGYRMKYAEAEVAFLKKVLSWVTSWDVPEFKSVNVVVSEAEYKTEYVI